MSNAVTSLARPSMKQSSGVELGFFHARTLLAVVLCCCGLSIAIFSVTANPTRGDRTQNNVSVAARPNLAGANSAGWSLIDPNVNDRTIASVACSSDANCWGVGTQTVGSLRQTLIQRWNGTAWSTISSPNQSTTYDNSLSSVSCASDSLCWAVGSYRISTGMSLPLTLRWNGSSWSRSFAQTVQFATQHALTGVGCASTGKCWAVGAAYGSGSGLVAFLLQSNNEGDWYLGNVSDYRHTLGGVACTQSTATPDCFAIGSLNGNIVIEKWQGGTSPNWVTYPSPDVGPSSSLRSITCPSASECWAVGSRSLNGQTQPLIERWDGTAWSIVDSPMFESDALLAGVGCSSAAQCWAVGNFSQNGILRTLIQRWDGTAWTVATSPNTTASDSNYLSSVSCASAAACQAVGYSVTGQRFFERWNGTAWAIVDPHYVTNAFQNPASVVCPTAEQCLAVGGYQYTTESQPLFERWNGIAWSYGTTPYLFPMGSFQHQLNDIACNSASDCWAVGSTYNGIGQTLIEHWNGSSWQVVPPPSLGGVETSLLRGVTCTSVTDCWAVGGYKSNDIFQPLIEHWNGISWATVPSPNVTQAGAILQDITCPSASDCWAVGYYTPNAVLQPLIERWDGTAWSITPSPSLGTSTQLNDITCTSASQCWAVGYQNNAGVAQTLILGWDGNSWQLVASPNSSDGGGILNGVTCVSPTQCRAVGTKDLIAQWDGNSWSLAPFFNAGNLFRNYESVACASDSHCWAIGTGAIAEYSTINPPLRGASSRMTHGSSGTFDVDQTPPGSTPSAVECRTTAEPGRYQMVFTFPAFSPIAASASVTGGGTVMSSGPGPNANEYVVDLTGVPDQTRVSVSLDNVVDAQNNTGSVSATLAALIGDTNGDGVVNSSDLDQAKTGAGETVGPTNFRTDVNANGAINASDIARIKANSGAQLP